MPMITVTLRGRTKPYRCKFKTQAKTVEEVLAEMCINPQEVLVKLNDEFVPDIEKIKSRDKIDLLEITSRG
jgi:sulfur carrier protein ThiS